MTRAEDRALRVPPVLISLLHPHSRFSVHSCNSGRTRRLAIRRRSAGHVVKIVGQLGESFPQLGVEDVAVVLAAVDNTEKKVNDLRRQREAAEQLTATAERIPLVYMFSPATRSMNSRV